MYAKKWREFESKTSRIGRRTKKKLRRIIREGKGETHEEALSTHLENASNGNIQKGGKGGKDK